MLEHFGYIFARFSRGFEESQAVLLGKCHAPCPVDLLLVIRHVRLIRHEHLHHVRLRMSLYLLEPILDVVEGDLLAAIVHEQDTHGTLVVRLRDRAESLLAGCVPHLQLDILAHEVDRLDPEVNANGRHV